MAHLRHFIAWNSRFLRMTQRHLSAIHLARSVFAFRLKACEAMALIASACGGIAKLGHRPRPQNCWPVEGNGWICSSRHRLAIKNQDHTSSRAIGFWALIGATLVKKTGIRLPASARCGPTRVGPPSDQKPQQLPSSSIRSSSLIRPLATATTASLSLPDMLDNGNPSRNTPQASPFAALF
ncbi:hypothetical protein ROLI_034240 [Roseobacter fucihabitans]|uniref:Uncharacterized protein n=1 Tax=Roseobacter fucihabitans TaxID=1537242 RepID=A0ABZ2BWI7_9RHOB|nr:hypothetical protein [Roseobacter litoralis]